jgi:predicted esterase YcpF (UPF0227 family)
MSVFDINGFIVSAITREVKKLYLSFLYTTEDLVKSGKLSEEDFAHLRKRILDYGNNTIRNLEEHLDNFDFTFKNKDNK